MSTQLWHRIFALFNVSQKKTCF
ncbi:hypothetical protein MASSI9I_60286 [Massilia sp. 9I]|nr:hypothetical protein MASSI9I_60286 [Massilia sp. 9I]